MKISNRLLNSYLIYVAAFPTAIPGYDFHSYSLNNVIVQFETVFKDHIKLK